MQRAAQVARQRAAEVSKRQQQPPVEHLEESQNIENIQDLPRLTFSQAHGYEEIPGPLKLEELPSGARTHIWNVFFVYLDASKRPEVRYPEPDLWMIADVWEEILRAKHVWHDNLPLDEWSADFTCVCRDLREDIETRPFYKVFDLLQFVLRHPECPSDFVSALKQVFSLCRLAYTIDEGWLPTIVPAVTAEEGNAVVESLKTLCEAGLRGGAEHLRNACECLNKGDWSGSIRESIGTVESVARMLAPEAKTLKPALAYIETQGALHPALKDALIKLYGYTSDERGLRHPLLEREKANVGMDEAVFMLGACASFASYLWRKHTAGEVA